MAATVTLNDLLDGHVVLDLQCLDRIYLNGYVPNLQVGGQVVTFMTKHLGYRIPSPAIMEKIGTQFRQDVSSFAEDCKWSNYVAQSGRALWRNRGSGSVRAAALQARELRQQEGNRSTTPDNSIKLRQIVRPKCAKYCDK